MVNKHVCCCTCGGWFQVLRTGYELGLGMAQTPLSNQMPTLPAHQAVPGKPSAEFRTATGKLIQTICDGSFREPSIIV